MAHAQQNSQQTGGWMAKFPPNWATISQIQAQPSSGLLAQTFRQNARWLCHACKRRCEFGGIFAIILVHDSQQGWTHACRKLVSLSPLAYHSYRALFMSGESSNCSFLKKKFFSKNSLISLRTTNTYKKPVSFSPLLRHVPIPYSS